MQIDIRDDLDPDITKIVFDDRCTSTGYSQAYALVKSELEGGFVDLVDEERSLGSAEGFVLVSSKQHALNLIKALEKAIELGWLE